MDLNIPSIGGKDSMSGTFEKLNVPPTLVSFAVGIADASKVISPEFKQSRSAVCLILPKYLPDKTIDIKSLIKNFNVVSKLINQKLIYSAASLRGNGLAESILKMCVGNKLGIEFDNVTPEELFGVNYGGIVLTISPKNKPQELLKGSNFKIIGHTTSNYHVVDKQRNIDISLLELEKQYVSRLESVFTSTTTNEQVKINATQYFKKVGKKAKYKVANPLVVIPVFPGTNCENDSQIAFEKAGAKVKQVLIRNNTSKDLLTSINELAK
jgi:phosphoribosylformylglycinamidine synthase